MSSFEQSYSFTFEAAHELGATQPGDVGHRYARVHGHSFLVEVTLRGEALGPEGWLTDFDILRKACQAVHDRLDHQFLNDIEEIGPPTLENIALFITGELRAALPQLASVAVSRPSLHEKVVHYP